MIATVAGGDVPGGAAGVAIVASAGIGGAATTVSGTIDLAGAATKTDASKTDKALGAMGNLGGLTVTAFSGGNLKAGEAAATLTNAGTLALNPADAARNVATAAEAGKTVVDTYNLVRDAIHNATISLPFPLVF